MVLPIPGFDETKPIFVVGFARRTQRGKERKFLHGSNVCGLALSDSAYAGLVPVTARLYDNPAGRNCGAAEFARC
jgi:hypothetical protein